MFFENYSTKALVVGGVIAGVLLGFAVAKIGGPQNYEECILKELPAVKSDKAFEFVVKVCSTKFPAPAGKPSTESSTTSFQGLKKTP